MYLLIRLLLSPFIRRLSMGVRLITSGVIFVALGIFFTVILSHQVEYVTMDQITPGGCYQDVGNIYLQPQDDTSVYVLHRSDFSPAVDCSLFNSGSQVSFHYADETVGIDAEVQNQLPASSSNLYQDAWPVVEINNGSKDFVTSDYSQHPQGFYKFNWSAGSIFILIGLAMIALPFIFPGLRRKRQTGFSISPPGVGTTGFSISQPVPGTTVPTGTQESSYQQPIQYSATQEYVSRPLYQNPTQYSEQ